MPPRQKIMGSVSVTAVIFLAYGASAWVVPSPLTALRTSRNIRMCDGDTDSPPPTDDEFSRELYEQLKTQAFTDDLYQHLSQRPEYETAELYKGLRARQDVSDPIYNELERRREMLADVSMPTEAQTPGEVIELVLRALRDVDFPREGHGVEVLRKYSSTRSSIAAEKQLSSEQACGQPPPLPMFIHRNVLHPNSAHAHTYKRVSPETHLRQHGHNIPCAPRRGMRQVFDYLQNSKYRVLLDWVSINYYRKLDLSMDRRLPPRLPLHLSLHLSTIIRLPRSAPPVTTFPPSLPSSKPPAAAPIPAFATVPHDPPPPRHPPWLHLAIGNRRAPHPAHARAHTQTSGASDCSCTPAARCLRFPPLNTFSLH